MSTSKTDDQQDKEQDHTQDPAPSSGRDPLGPILDSFLRRFRKGERPSLTEYIGRYPALADEIRELFPALVELEQLGSLGGVADREATPRVPGDPRPRNRQTRALRSGIRARPMPGIVRPGRPRSATTPPALGPSGWATTASSAASAQAAWASSTRRSANHSGAGWP